MVCLTVKREYDKKVFLQSSYNDQCHFLARIILGDGIFQQLLGLKVKGKKLACNGHRRDYLKEVRRIGLYPVAILS